MRWRARPSKLLKHLQLVGWIVICALLFFAVATGAAAMFRVTAGRPDSGAKLPLQ